MEQTLDVMNLSKRNPRYIHIMLKRLKTYFNIPLILSANNQHTSQKARHRTERTNLDYDERLNNFVITCTWASTVGKVTRTDWQHCSKRNAIDNENEWGFSF